MTNTRTGGEILMDCLLGARREAGLRRARRKLPRAPRRDARRRRASSFVNARHEGGAAFMAEAHGKLTGEPGLCFVTRGPGATNAAIGIHTARQNSSPMIMFVGQVGTDMKGREAFQEIDYAAFFGPVAKWAVEIDRPERIPEIVARAWTTALSGRPGPVVVALPEDMLTTRVAAPADGPAAHPRTRPRTPAVAELQTLLDRAERPVALVGGGGWSDRGPRAPRPRDAAARACPSSPPSASTTSTTTRTRIRGRSRRRDAASVNQTLTEADLILAIGVRFGEMTTDAYTVPSVPKPAQTLVHVHASDAELGKIYVADLPIHAAPAPFLAALEGTPGHPPAGSPGATPAARPGSPPSTCRPSPAPSTWARSWRICAPRSPTTRSSRTAPATSRSGRTSSSASPAPSASSRRSRARWATASPPPSPPRPNSPTAPSSASRATGISR
jgi:acetolactate synthase I/II/III large subunit